MQVFLSLITYIYMISWVPMPIYPREFLYLSCYLLIYFTLWSRVLLEKLTGSRLVKKFPTFYGNRKFITALTSARHLSLFWASSTQSIPQNPTSWRSILILSSHQSLRFSSGLFPWGFPHQNPIYASPLPHTCYVLHPFHSSRFDNPNNIGWGLQIPKLLIM
jgi:hypothetical protein